MDTVAELRISVLATIGLPAKKIAASMIMATKKTLGNNFIEMIVAERGGNAKK